MPQSLSIEFEIEKLFLFYLVPIPATRDLPPWPDGGLNYSITSMSEKPSDLRDQIRPAASPLKPLRSSYRFPILGRYSFGKEHRWATLRLKQ